MKICFRTDNQHIAEAKALGREWRKFYGAKKRWNETPPAEPGDVWRVRWYRQNRQNNEGPVAGYDICCPRCRHVHAWTTAHNCGSRRSLPDGGGFTCDHMGKSSCWTWTGSAEEGTLTASPSLHASAEHGGCGWHGWLQNGDLHE